MSGLFGRQVVLQLGKEGTTGRELRDLTIDFRVDMSRSSDPNRAVVEVINAAPDTIALAQDPACVVRLLAGYEMPLQIFRGNPIEHGVVVERRGPDRVLHIEAQDGQRELSSGRVNLSFATQTTTDQVFSEVAAQMGLATGTIRLPETVTLSQGGVWCGHGRDILDSLCNTIGAEWYVRDGALQIVSRGGTTGESAVVFSSRTGNLIGSPKRTSDGVEVTALISPTLRPGKLFQVDSADVTGLYVCDTLVFDGSSGKSTPFYVIPRGVPYAA